MTTGRQIVLSALTALAAIVYLGKPADAARCGNSPAGFEAWKREFGEEAKAKGIGATRRRRPDASQLCQCDHRRRS